MVSSDPTYDELAEEYGQNGRSRPVSRGVPQDQAAEESVLGAILAEQGVYERLAGMLEPTDFMDPRHRAIFAAVLAVFDRYEAIDQITVAAELSTQGRLQEAGGQAYLNQLVYELPATVGAEHYARLVQRAATYRDMIRAAGEIGELAYRADPNVGESLTQAVETALRDSRSGSAAGLSLAAGPARRCPERRHRRSIRCPGSDADGIPGPRRAVERGDARF